MFRTAAGVIAVVLLWLPSGAGAADVLTGPDRPWAKDVSAEEQRIAQEIFREGNSLLKESVFVQATAKYRDAIKHWDHPAIHYNLVLALLNMDQPLEVREHLIAALSYGPEPLDQDKFEQAKAYKLLIEKQLVQIEVRCDEPGAEVVMDGRKLFVAPGKYESFVRSGPHTIVATKAGYLPHQFSKALPAGENASFDVKLYKTTELTRYERRWSVGLPWAFVVAGALVGGAGGGLHFGASRSFQQFDQRVLDRGGSAPDADLMALRSRGQTMQGFAIGCYGVGGAALLTGAILVYLNRLQPYQDLAPLENKRDAEGASFFFTPTFDGHGPGIAATLHF
jgi:hypothetical protein